MESRTQKMLIVLTFGLMLVQGCIDNIRGVLIPSIKEAFLVSYTSIATMILVSTFGYIMATFTGGMMTDRVGQKKVILIGFAFVLAAIFGISTAGVYYLFVLAMFVLGYGIGLLTIGASTLAPIIFVKNQGVMMNLMHFFYGIGATIGPRFAGGLLNAGVTWQNIYRYGLIPVGVVLIYFLLCKFPKIEESEKEEKISLLEILKHRRVILFSLLLGFYVASEVGLANWFATYLQHAKGMTELSSASYLSIFFMIFTVGRLVGGFIAEKLGYMRSVFLFVSLALVCLIIGVFGDQNLTIVISIGGFFFSIVYPTMMVVLIKSFKKGLNSILGVVMTASSGINMLANWVIGRVNDVFNEAVGFSMIILFLIMVLLFLILLNRELSHQSE
ncbi:MFS transporter [Anaerosolibacter sp.]|uniref:MFS transporter n=1 Tax=Anaerosolibacter sp. TaxID=1872527 RepID=UPI0039F0CB41